MNQKELEIYIHIPFCIKKCSYCDFLAGPATEQTVESYMAALFAEIEGKSGKYRDRRVVSVFIGGGTPSRLTGEQMGKLMACIRRHFSLAPATEISTEVLLYTVHQPVRFDGRRGAGGGGGGGAGRIYEYQCGCYERIAGTDA